MFSHPSLKLQGFSWGIAGMGGMWMVMPSSLPRFPALRLSRSWDRLEDPVPPAPASDKGFDNPVFNVVSHHCQGHRGAWGHGQELLGAMTLLKASWDYPDRGPAFPRPGGVCGTFLFSLRSPASQLLRGLSTGWALPRVLLLFPIGCFSFLAVAGASRC